MPCALFGSLKLKAYYFPSDAGVVEEPVFIHSLRGKEKVSYEVRHYYELGYGFWSGRFL